MSLPARGECSFRRARRPTPAAGRLGGRLRAAAAGVLLLTGAAAARAQTREPGGAAGREPAPRAVVVLAPGLTGGALVEALEEPRWRSLRAAAGLAAVNARVAGPASRVSACLTLGAGRRLYCPPGPPGARTAALPGTAGPLPAAMPAAALGAANGSGAGPGALAAACAAAGKRVAFLGRITPDGAIGGAGFLTAMDASGAVLAVSPEEPAEEPGAWVRAAARFAPPPDLLVVDLPSATPPARALAVAGAFAARLHPRRDLLLLTSPDPGPPEGGQWGFLAPALFLGGDWAGTLAISQTTRTRGLLALVDLTSTLLDHLGVPPRAGMEGHAARPAGAGGTAELAAIHRHARATRLLMAPVLLAWGALVAAAALWATALLVRRERAGGGTQRAAGERVWPRRLLLLGAAFPAAMLLSAAAPVRSTGELLLRLPLAAAAVAGASEAAGRGRHAVRVALAAMGALVAADLLLPSQLLSWNLMSDFPNTGARFYGIGNEYEGLFIAVVLALPFWIQQSRGRRRFSRRALAAAGVLWGGAAILLGAPSLGADFGGAAALGFAALGAGFIFAQPDAPARLTLRRVAAGVLLVCAGTALLAGFDALRPPGSRTHVGELVARARAEGAAPVLELAARKAAMNLSMALSPYFAVGMAVLAPLLWLWYSKLGPAVRRVILPHPLTRGGFLSLFCGGVAALFLNDSGVVAWALASGTGILVGLDLLLDEAARKDAPCD